MKSLNAHTGLGSQSQGFLLNTIDTNADSSIRIRKAPLRAENLNSLNMVSYSEAKLPYIPKSPGNMNSIMGSNIGNRSKDASSKPAPSLMEYGYAAGT